MFFRNEYAKLQITMQTIDALGTVSVSRAPSADSASGSSAKNTNFVSCASSISDQRSLQMSKLSGLLRNASRGSKLHLPTAKAPGNTPRVLDLQSRARAAIHESKRARSQGNYSPSDDEKSDSPSVSVGTGSQKWNMIGDGSVSAPSQKIAPP